MKKISVFLLIIVLATSCVSVKQIGKVNMISTRNVNPNLEYQLISSYSGGSKKELKKSRSVTVEDAIDNTVKKVPGGEFLMNCKIYVVNSQYIAVEGDVWGVRSSPSYRGFQVGTKVTWKKKNILKGSQFLTGTITLLKDDKTCLVKVDGDTNEIVELSYDEISKIE